MFYADPMKHLNDMNYGALLRETETSLSNHLPMAMQMFRDALLKAAHVTVHAAYADVTTAIENATKSEAMVDAMSASDVPSALAVYSIQDLTNLMDAYKIRLESLKNALETRSRVALKKVRQQTVNMLIRLRTNYLRDMMDCMKSKLATKNNKRVYSDDLVATLKVLQGESEIYSAVGDEAIILLFAMPGVHALAKVRERHEGFYDYLMDALQRYEPDDWHLGHRMERQLLIECWLSTVPRFSWAYCRDPYVDARREIGARTSSYHTNYHSTIQSVRTRSICTSYVNHTKLRVFFARIFADNDTAMYKMLCHHKVFAASITDITKIFILGGAAWPDQYSPITEGNGSLLQYSPEMQKLILIKVGNKQAIRPLVTDLQLGRGPARTPLQLFSQASQKQWLAKPEFRREMRLYARFILWPLLRLHVKFKAIAWYWWEAKEKTKYHAEFDGDGTPLLMGNKAASLQVSYAEGNGVDTLGIAAAGPSNEDDPEVQRMAARARQRALKLRELSQGLDSDSESEFEAVASV